MNNDKNNTLIKLKKIINIYTYLALILCFLVLLTSEKIKIFFLGMLIGLFILDIMLIKIGGKKIMGTNYYAVKRKPCLNNRIIHIGKSSGGWLFLFHDNDNFHTYPQFKKWLEDNVDTGEYVLFNECEEEVSKEFLLDLIDKKQKDKHCLDNPNNFENAKNIDGYRFAQGEFS